MTRKKPAVPKVVERREKPAMAALLADKRRLDWLQSQIDPVKQRRNRGHVVQTIYVFNNETLRDAIDAGMAGLKAEANL